MASRVGIDVLEFRLMPLAEIEGLPPEVLSLNVSNAFVVRRFDRKSDKRIHVEDFAQATGCWPADKYTPSVNYTDMPRLVAQVSDESDVLEFSHRLMFNTIVGNGDMHLKACSFIYPDGRTPALSPAYDLLCTTVYIVNDDSALKLGSTRKWHELTLEDLSAVAEGASVDQKTFVNAAVKTIVRFRDGWEDCVKSPPIDERLKQSIEMQMSSCPAVRSEL